MTKAEPKKRVKGQFDETTKEPKLHLTDFEDVEDDLDDEDEEDFDEEEEDEEEISDSIRVFFRERPITRRFAAKQTLTSGGNLDRVYSVKDHGKKYRAAAIEFIQSMLTVDQDSTERPKFLRVVGLDEEECENLGLTDTGVVKPQ